MILETKPIFPLAMSFPPADGKPYTVTTGESWITVAADHGMPTWDLIEFNFPAVVHTKDIQQKCREVNWSLREHVGCTKSSDGKNYRFDSGDKPGKIFLPKKKKPVSKCGSLTAAERADILAMGGPDMLLWAETPPTKAVESKAFLPAARHRADFSIILAWKSCDPSRTCALDGKRRGFQAVMLLHDDLDYWRSRTTSEIEASIKSTSQTVAVRAYRHRILDLKQCPVSARLAEIALGKTLILIMATGLLSMIPTPGAPGTKTVKSVASVAGFLATKLNEFLNE